MKSLQFFKQTKGVKEPAGINKLYDGGVSQNIIDKIFSHSLQQNQPGKEQVWG